MVVVGRLFASDERRSDGAGGGLVLALPGQRALRLEEGHRTDEHLC